MFIDSPVFGGAERTTLTLIAGLDRSRWSPTLLHHATPALDAMVAEAAQMGVADLVVPAMPDGGAGALAIPGFARVLRANRFDVFHAQLTWPLMAKFALATAVMCRVPAVLATVHSFPEFTMTRPTALQQRALGRVVGRYIAVSRNVAEQLEEKIGIAHDRIVVVHNGVDVPAWLPKADPRLRAELAGPDDLPVVLTAARLVHEKGIDVLLDAAALVAHARFVIAGAGPEHDALAARIAALGLEGRVVLLGFRDDVKALLAAADIFVLPTRLEAFSISLLEALAAGKPAVASHTGGVPELIDDGVTGLLVPVDDAAAIATSVTRLIADPALRTRIGEAGRDSAMTRFTARRMTDGVTSEYECLLASAGRARRAGRRHGE
jgi:glycosyltransferase involved in cell wall biosynthesis